MSQSSIFSREKKKKKKEEEKVKMRWGVEGYGDAHFTF